MGHSLDTTQSSSFVINRGALTPPDPFRVLFARLPPYPMPGPDYRRSFRRCFNPAPEYPTSGAAAEGQVDIARQVINMRFKPSFLDVSVFL